MSVLIARKDRPELFPEDERPLADMLNTVEAVYSELCTKPSGYDQQEFLRALRDAGISSYDANLALTILFQLKKVLTIIG